MFRLAHTPEDRPAIIEYCREQDRETVAKLLEDIPADAVAVLVEDYDTMNFIREAEGVCALRRLQEKGGQPFIHFCER